MSYQECKMQHRVHGPVGRAVFFCMMVLMLTCPALSARVVWKTGTITIAGNTAFTGENIRAVMETRPAGFLRPSKYSRARLFSDLGSIRELYRQNGYLGAEAKIDSVVFDTSSRRVAAWIGITEGPQTLVDSVRILGKTRLSVPRMQRSLLTRTGGPLNRVANDKDAVRIEDIHKGRGYLFCQVADSVVTDTASHRASVSFTIDHGPLVFAGPLRLTGQRSVLPVVIERQLKFRSGDTLSSRKMKAAVRRLYGTTLFNFVQIEPVMANGAAENDTVHPPVSVVVEEANFFLVNASAGYGTIDRYRGSLLTRYSNLFGLGHALAVSGNGTTISQKAELSYSVPWIFSFPLQASLGAYVEHYNENYLGLFDGLRLSLSQGTEWYLDYRLWTSLERTEYSLPLRDSAPERTFTNTQKIGADLTWDNRPADRRLHRGFCFIFQPELAGLGGRGTNQYYRGLIDLRAYSRPFPWMRGSNAITLAFAKGYRDATGDVPLHARYFLGTEGVRPLRGYSQNDIKTLFPGGGRVVALVNLFEGQFTIYKWIGGTVFMDGGYAWDTPAEVTARDMKWVAGPGLFFKTPIGDLQFDWGYRLNDRRWGSPYISFGQAF